ncbi:hypothetical protein BDD21_0098 [Thiocapsa rosea]|uniref:Uncharacterized protein n=1 Tax=Thiocapsa rosea TaxID=69360 RepID=A0A495V2K2_9GAMM|nr:hypothetical protein BDD21_0098 [Thiocapsa rosea]
MNGAAGDRMMRAPVSDTEIDARPDAERRRGEDPQGLNRVDWGLYLLVLGLEVVVVG